MKKYGFLISGDEEYGVSRMLRSFIAEISLNGGHCEVLSISNGALADRLLAAGVSVNFLNLRVMSNYKNGGLGKIIGAFNIFLQTFQALRLVRDWLKVNNCDVFIVRMPNLVPLAAISARAAGMRASWIMPNAVSDSYFLKINKLIYEIFIYFFNLRVFANSKYTASTLLNWSSSPEVLYLGVNSREFEPVRDLNFRKKLDLSSNSIVIGIFARVLFDKGQELAIRALKLVDNRDIVLLIVGGGDLNYINYLKNLVEELNVSRNVKFIGPVDDVALYYGVCDLTANLRVTPEPFGLSVIESMMMGLPVLGHASGAPAETIIDGVTGWLIKDVEPFTIADGMNRVLKSRGQLQEMANSSMQHARENYDMSVVVSNFEGMHKNESIR